MEIELKTAGKAPVNSGILTRGLQTTVVAAVVGVTLRDAPSDSVVRHILSSLFVV